MSSQELSIMLTAKGNLEGELKKNRDRLKELNAEIRTIQRDGGTVGEDLASEFRTASLAATKLSSELSQVNRDVKKLSTDSSLAASKFSQAWMKASSAFNNNFVAGLSTGALVMFGKSAIKTFASVQDAQTALSATFGAQGDALIKWAQSSGDALNLSQAQAMQAAQTFAIFGQSAGLAGGSLVKFSTDLATRAADLASYFGGSTEDAIQALSSGLAGQSEVLRRFGIFTDEATLKAQALAMGIGDGTTALTAQQKILATQAVILEQSARAQGDVAFTAESMANRMKDAEQQLADFRSTAGETASLVAGPALGALNDAARAFQTLPEPVKGTAVAVGFLGSAALIATSRIAALRANMALAGMSFSGFAGGAKRAAIAIGGIGTALAAVSAIASQNESGTMWTPFRGMYDDANELSKAMFDLKNGYEESWSVLALEKLGAGVQMWTSRSQEARRAVDAYDAQLTQLMSGGKTSQAQRLFEQLAKSAKQHGLKLNDVKQMLPGYSGALDVAAAMAGNTAEKTDDAADAVSRLTGAVNKFSQAADLARSLTGFRKVMKEALGKPGRDAALEVVDAFGAAYGNFAEGSKAQAQFVIRNYDDVKRTLENSGLGDAMRRQLLSPLEEAKAEADAIMNRLTGQGPVKINFGPTPLAPVKRALGGLVTGPGTGTSDSIPALLSNGEYVLRSAAVKRLGLNTLDRLNQGDKLADPSLLARMNQTAGTPVVAEQSAFHVEVNVHNPKDGTDVEKAVMRGLNRAERIRKERG